jgi:hypothetical protein
MQFIHDMGYTEHLEEYLGMMDSANSHATVAGLEQLMSYHRDSEVLIVVP